MPSLGGRRVAGRLESRRNLVQERRPDRRGRAGPRPRPGSAVTATGLQDHERGTTAAEDQDSDDGNDQASAFDPAGARRHRRRSRPHFRWDGKRRGCRRRSESLRRSGGRRGTGSGRPCRGLAFCLRRAGASGEGEGSAGRSDGRRRTVGRARVIAHARLVQCVSPGVDRPSGQRRVQRQLSMQGLSEAAGLDLVVLTRPQPAHLGGCSSLGGGAERRDRLAVHAVVTESGATTTGVGRDAWSEPAHHLHEGVSRGQPTALTRGARRRAPGRHRPLAVCVHARLPDQRRSVTRMPDAAEELLSLDSQVTGPAGSRSRPLSYAGLRPTPGRPPTPVPRCRRRRSSVWSICLTPRLG